MTVTYKEGIKEEKYVCTDRNRDKREKIQREAQKHKIGL